MANVKAAGVMHNVAVPGGMPRACLCSSAAGIGTLVEASKRVSVGERFVLLIRAGKQLQEGVLPAFLNAYVRFVEREMKTDSLQMELLLCIAGTLNIKKAIESCGADTNRRFVLVSSDARTEANFVRALGIRVVERYALSFDGDPEFVPVI